MVHGLLLFFEVVYAVAIGLLLFSIIAGMSIYGVSAPVQVVLLIAVILGALITALLLYKALHTRFLRIKTGREALIGARGEAVTALNPKGQIRVLSEFWQARALEGWIEKGKDVEVTGMDGLFLIVKVAEEKV
jgi:membrane-bound serine protease (ClpP class)